MKTLRYIFFCIFSATILLSCEKSKVTEKKFITEKGTYNQEANELVLQVMSTSGCNCIVEIPTRNYSNMSETKKAELRKYYIKWLKLNKNSNVDSILKLADEFKWDENLLKKNKIKLIKYDSSQDIEMGSSEESVRKFFIAKQESKDRFWKLCPNGAYSIERPIIDNKLKTAIIRTGITPSCFPAQEWIFKFESGKWVGEK